MSVETIAWAKEQRCGCPYAKAVLLELANWARPDGVCQFRRVRDIAFVVELSERTIQRVLFRLEDNTPADMETQKKAGLNLIRRVESFRADGGQQANSFLLVGYSRQGDRQSPPKDKASPGGCLSDGGGDDSAVTPQEEIESKKKDSPNAPKAVRRVRQQIAHDWIAPAIEKLPTIVRVLVNQWPSGAYEAEAEAFFQHAIGTGSRYADWNALWASKVQAQHAAMLRAAKAGIAFAATRTVSEIKAKVSAPRRPVSAQALEDERSARLRGILRPKVDDQTWSDLFNPAAFLFDVPGLKVIVSSSFAQEELETRYPSMMRAAAQTVEPDTTWIRIEAEPRGMRKHLL